MPGEVGVLIAGRYLLSEPVGQSGTGRVWRAHDEVLDREVAVKEVLLPPRSPAGHADLLAAAMGEARATARLEHPGVITIHDVVEHDDAPCIVMRFISGSSLSAEIASDRAIVTDFGIARILDASAQLAGAGMRIGTAAYLAPEQLEDSQVGPPADLWALGATLYYATEGRPPFTGSTMTAVMAAILTRRLTPPEHAGPLRDLVEALLSKDPAGRPDARSAMTALAALAAMTALAAANVPPATAGPAHDTPAAGHAVPAAPRRREVPFVAALAAAARSNPRLAVGAITAIVMVVALILVVTLFPSHPRQPGSPTSPGHSGPP
jgi:peptide/nickel transport system substrate-binding protein